jgi:nucleoid-associated protein YgaU
VTDRLLKGQKLHKGDSLTSENGAYTLTLQDDGNLVLAARGDAVWSTGTNGQDIERAEVQDDGNFVLYTSDKPVWHTDTEGAQDARLILQDDRNLVLYALDDGKVKAAWSSKTNTDEAPPSAVDPGEAAGATVAAATAAAAEAPAAEAPAAEAPPPPPPAPEPALRTYTVVSGDTLWAISERFYGDGNKYQQIADASGVPNPDLIYPGQVLTIP